MEGLGKQKTIDDLTPRQPSLLNIFRAEMSNSWRNFKGCDEFIEQAQDQEFFPHSERQ